MRIYNFDKKDLASENILTINCSIIIVQKVIKFLSDLFTKHGLDLEQLIFVGTLSIKKKKEMNILMKQFSSSVPPTNFKITPLYADQFPGLKTMPDVRACGLPLKPKN